MSTSAVFAKLNLKDQPEICVLNAPERFEAELGRLQGVTVRRDLSGASRVSFALAFVKRPAEVDALAKSFAKMAGGDAVVWFAYPKGTSKRYTCEINRDTGWKALEAAGFESVRNGGHRRGLDGQALPACRIHQDDETRRRPCDVQGRQGADDKKLNWRPMTDDWRLSSTRT